VSSLSQYTPFQWHNQHTSVHMLRRYDTIRDAILTCTLKADISQLIYRTEPKARKWENEELKVIEKQWCDVCWRVFRCLIENFLGLNELYNSMVKLLRCLSSTVTVFYCTFFLLILSVCMSLCVCVLAMLPDSNKKMIRYAEVKVGRH